MNIIFFLLMFRYTTVSILYIRKKELMNNILTSTDLILTLQHALKEILSLREN